MAAILPTDIFPSWALASGNITIALTDLNGLSTAEANATTGDGREVIRIIVETIFVKLNALATADRPTRVTASRSTAGLAGGDVNITYSIACQTAISASAASLLSEPA